MDDKRGETHDDKRGEKHDRTGVSSPKKLSVLTRPAHLSCPVPQALMMSNSGI